MRCKLNNQLVECLAAKEIKKSQLAHRLHMSRAYVTRLVDGDIRPSLEAAIRIARFFRKPVEEIFQLEEANPGLNADARAAVPSVSQIHFPDALPPALGEPTSNGGKTQKQIT